jgi:hypothetical protein
VTAHMTEADEMALSTHLDAVAAAWRACAREIGQLGGLRTVGGLRLRRHRRFRGRGRWPDGAPGTCCSYWGDAEAPGGDP